MTAESPERDEDLLPSSGTSLLPNSPAVFPGQRKSPIPSSDFQRRIKFYKNSLKSSALAHVNLNFSSQLAVMAQLSAHRSLVARAKAKVDTSPPASMFTPLGRKNEQTKMRIRQMSGNILTLGKAGGTPRAQSARGFSPAQSNLTLVEKMDQFLASHQATQPPRASVSLSDKIWHFLQSTQDPPPAAVEVAARQEVERQEAESAKLQEERWIPSQLSSTSLSMDPTADSPVLPSRYDPHMDPTTDSSVLPSRYHSGSDEWPMTEPASQPKLSLTSQSKLSLTRSSRTSQDNTEELKIQFKTDLTSHILKYQAFTDRSLLQVCQIFRKRYQHQMSSEAMDAVIAELMNELHISTPEDT